MSYLYGLCTAEGKIIVDPVYSNAYQLSNIDEDMGGIAEDREIYPAIYLEIVTDEKDEYDWPITRCGAAAMDGSWYTGCVFDTVVASTKYLTCRRDRKISVFDYSGKKVSEFSIPEDSYVYAFDENDMSVLSSWANGESKSYFINLKGEQISPEKAHYEPFYGEAATFTDNETGTMGVVNRSFEVTVEPGRYDYISSFKQGTALADSYNGSTYNYYLIDVNGNVLFYSDQWLSYVGNGYYEYYSYDSSDDSYTYYYVKCDGSDVFSLEDGSYRDGVFMKKDGTIKIAAGSPEEFLDTGIEATESYYYIQRLDDENYLLTGDKKAYVWNAKTNKSLFIETDDYAYPLNDYIISGCYDNDLRKLFDKTGKRILSGDMLGGSAFTSDFTILSSNTESVVLYKGKAVLRINNGEDASE